MSWQSYRLEGILGIIFVEPACSELDIVVTISVWCMCVGACVLLSRLVSSPEHEVLMVSYCDQSMCLVHVNKLL